MWGVDVITDESKDHFPIIRERMVFRRQLYTLQSAVLIPGGEGSVVGGRIGHRYDSSEGNALL
jgi:hypothetical protein